MPVVVRLSVTPVKGTALIHPDRVEISETGIVGNRRHFLIDESGSLVSGSDVGPLVTVRATEVEGGLRLAFLDGTVVEADTSALGEAVVTDFYGRPVSGHVLEGPASEAFSAFVRAPMRLVRADRDGDGPDVHALTAVSSASIRDLGARGRHEGDLDGRRFRINIELDGCAPYEEDGWDGLSVRVGDALLRIRGQIPRCIVTTQDPETGKKDWDTLTQIAKYRPRIAGNGGLPFGVYADVEGPGTVAVGDPVRIAEQPI
jgi:uncharacterized protein YcbX